jgi:SAM-dependent methyltransferase
MKESANPYRLRIWEILRQMLLPLGPQARVLDFGCGDAWFAARMLEERHALELVPLDVKRRQHVCLEPRLYDGARLPFDAGSFDLSYTVDVIHHCAEPFAALDELLRVSRRYLLLKDHIADGPLDLATLAVLDEIGNRRFGIPSPHHYQVGRSWDDHLEARGWLLRRYVHPARVHSGLLGALTNRLQFVALYERGG